MQLISNRFKKNNENGHNLPPSAIRGKRVVAPAQPGRVTRSKVHVPTQAEIPIQATGEVHATDTEDDGPTLTCNKMSYLSLTLSCFVPDHGQQNNCHIDTRNDSSMNEANETLSNQNWHTLNDTNMNENAQGDSEGIFSKSFDT